jgi:predicted RNA-binding Zn ribbon-like protein
MTATAKAPEGFIFDLPGGKLCLDFANTVSGTRAAPVERLSEYGDLISWSLQVGIIDHAQANQLRARAHDHPKNAASALQRARELREAIFRVFAAAVHGADADNADLDLLNQHLSRSFSHLRLEKQTNGLALSWADTEALDYVLWPVAKSAADILTSSELERVHMCGANESCDWLFFDETRNRSRRWCSMKDCGNRAKARRHYERLKQSR